MATAMQRPPPRASKAVFAVLLFYFLPITFSEDMLYAAELTVEMPLPAVALPLLDSVLLFISYLLVKLVWRQNIRVSRRHRVAWRIAAGGTVALDSIRAFVAVPIFGGAFYRIPAGLELATSTAYVASMAMLVLATFAVTPREAIRRRGEGWADFSATIPLLVGAFVSYMAAILWEGQIGIAAVRTDCAEDCSGSIDPEYFAQLSQIILLLLIGVGLESSHFRRALRSSAQRAGLAVMVLILFLGEVLALSALVRSNQGEADDVLNEGHEYFAFLFVVQAAAVGLAALAWALLANSSELSTSEHGDTRE
ncbi:hypothetical protein SAMN06893096_101287 [Geodermatophilus pulveris]|uniref:Uncharacterized protein n=1 Tax=Geodermatophilus pulveris TaxID=1564159 RepID=A0A239AWR7_9ACTN|nr:hypothetical protein [Geodermatophilus pulveris]SNS00135.1 hypothetical protein SAMN06893096_101287 [Geodermatophilus pulveris]